MLGPPPGTRVFLACGTTDMRKGFDGLAAQVQTVLAQDPYSGAMFCFRGRRGDLLKILVWDGQGLILVAKRLEKGRFVWPQTQAGVVSLTAAQLSMLFEGIDWRIEVLVERVLASTRGVVGDDRDGALGGDRLAQRVGVVGRIGNDHLGRKPVDQRVGLRAVAALSAGQGEAHWGAQAANGQVDLGTQAAAGAAKGLIFSPPFFAPAACWWARMMVLSTIRYSKSGSSDMASKMRRHTPLSLQRLNRRNTLFHSPKTSGRSRQGEPVRTIHSTPSTNIRLSRPVEPFWSGRPMISGAIRSQAASLSTRRSNTPKATSRKAALNHVMPSSGIPRVHTT
jgi:transposase